MLRMSVNILPLLYSPRFQRIIVNFWNVFAFGSFKIWRITKTKHCVLLYTLQPVPAAPHPPPPPTTPLPIPHGRCNEEFNNLVTEPFNFLLAEKMSIKQQCYIAGFVLVWLLIFIVPGGYYYQRRMNQVSCSSPSIYCFFSVS